MQSFKDVRATASCTECQRRKQKCSREWPCNHCQARKVPHLCQFGPKKQAPSPSESSRDARGQKRRFLDPSEPSEPSSISENANQDDPEDGLKVWGYMPGHVHYALNKVDGEISPHKGSPTQSDKSDEVDAVLHAIPPRSITDAIVNHFLTVVNYRYSVIYAPTFTEQYVKWWSNRAENRRPSPEFTCLLLRVLSYSVQYLTPELRRMIEFELARKPQSMTEQFSVAADQLSNSFSASKTCIERVQELFYKGAWLKSESRIVESWHTLGRVIREAQELGIDTQSGLEGLAEFDIEIRRRVWTLLYIWDWQMSAWLSRPHLIDQKEVAFEFPNLRLDQSASEPNLLSPFAHMALQASIARRISPLLVDVQDIRDLSPDQLSAILEEMHRFIDDLPPVFRVEDPDLSLDERHPYFVFQRHQLHVVTYMTMLDFLKPHLTRDPKKLASPNYEKFRADGVDLALKLLAVSRLVFDHEYPINAKFHMIIFAIFDTSTLLCSAVIHDVEGTLPFRQEVIAAVESGLDMLYQLSSMTKLGASSYWFLLKLVQASPVLSQHGPINKRQRGMDKSGSTKSSSVLATPLTQETLPSVTAPPAPKGESGAVAAPALNDIMPLPDMGTTDDLFFDLDQYLAQNPWDDASSLDIGGMEVVWDWDELNLDLSLMNNGTMQGPPQ